MSKFGSMALARPIECWISATFSNALSSIQNRHLNKKIISIAY